jgi:hypothetical protein
MTLDHLISEISLIRNKSNKCVHVYYMFIPCILNYQPTRLYIAF